jgi:hypothetical protein
MTAQKTSVKEFIGIVIFGVFFITGIATVAIKMVDYFSPADFEELKTVQTLAYKEEEECLEWEQVLKNDCQNYSCLIRNGGKIIDSKIYACVKRTPRRCYLVFKNCHDHDSPNWCDIESEQEIGCAPSQQ